MGHKTLIDGVGYDITGGRCLVDGVGYSIQKGRTLVDGVGYDVAFGGAAILVTITGSGTSTDANVTINGVKYYTAQNNIEVKAGDVLDFRYVSGTTAGYLSIDGTQVISGRGTTNYYWTVPTGITAITINLYFYDATYGRHYTQITVTTS